MGDNGSESTHNPGEIKTEDTDDASASTTGNTQEVVTKENIPGETKTLNTEGQSSVANTETSAQVPVIKPRVRTPKVLDVRLLDIRVGLVDDVEEVEDEKGVYLLTVNIKKPNYCIASSKFLSRTGFDVLDLIDKKVVTVVNIPPTYLQDETTCDIRVLAAAKMGGEDGKEVVEMEILRPPKKAKIGKRIYADGYFQEQYWQLKEKMYRIILKDMVVDSERHAVYKGSPLRVAEREEFITTKRLLDCPIIEI